MLTQYISLLINPVSDKLELTYGRSQHRNVNLSL